MNERTQGTIKLWKKDNGYGFVAVKGSKDIFVHITAVENLADDQNELEVGQAVEFEIVPGKGDGQLQAANVVIL